VREIMRVYRSGGRNIKEKQRFMNKKEKATDI
jgi:hypothetical protein